MALGSSRGRALWLILRRGVVLLAAGLVLGLAGGVVFTTTLESYLWEVTPTDLVSFSIIPSILAVLSLVACYLAARRALPDRPGYGAPAAMMDSGAGRPVVAPFSGRRADEDRGVSDQGRASIQLARQFLSRVATGTSPFARPAVWTPPANSLRMRASERLVSRTEIEPASAEASDT